MTPVKPGAYLFRKESITELRQRLGLSQAAMAARIGVPKNTVSRWETGETTPDAQSLAAIYSLGMEVGVVATFFAPVKQKAPARRIGLVYWDMNSVYVAIANPYLSLTLTSGIPDGAGQAVRLDGFIRSEVRKRIPRADSLLFKIFSNPIHSPITDHLMANDQVAGTDQLERWRVWEDNTNWLPTIYSQARSDVGQEPGASVAFLITADEAYAELIEELASRGSSVYLMAPSDVRQSLKDAVGPKRFIAIP